MYVFLFLRNSICTMITMGSKNSLLKFHPSLFYETAVFPHIRPTDISISHSLQMRVLFKNTTFSLHKIITVAGIIQGRVLLEDIWKSNERFQSVSKIEVKKEYFNDCKYS